MSWWPNEPAWASSLPRPVQVMPPALLEMTRACMRAVFTSVLSKRIYTLQFRRGTGGREEHVQVLKLHAKLQSAREHGGVVCAAPESVKSVVLKFVEVLHLLEMERIQENMVSSIAGVSKQALQEEMVAGQRLMAASEMARAIVPILDMWKNGVLIMDEARRIRVRVRVGVTIRVTVRVTVRDTVRVTVRIRVTVQIRVTCAVRCP